MSAARLHEVYATMVPALHWLPPPASIECMFDPGTSQYRRVRTVIQLLLLLAVVVAVSLSTRVTLFDPQVTLGAIAEVEVVGSGLTFDARIDTGASASSVHCLEFEITGAVRRAARQSWQGSSISD